MNTDTAKKTYIDAVAISSYLRRLERNLFFGQVTLVYRDGKISTVEEKKQYKYPEDIEK
jgi:hypothetical protein